jgi:hypothetical protein
MLTEAMVEISIGSSTGQRPKRAKLFRQSAARARHARWNETRDREERNDTDHHDRPECRTPSGGLSQSCAEWHTEHIGQRKAGEHQRHRLRALLTWHQIAGNDGANSEERAMGKGSDHARGHQQPVIRREGAAEITDREQRHQSQESSLARDACGRHCHDGCADHDAQCITRHEIAGLRDGHRQAARDVGQQAHDDELGRADAERCRSQCENRKG